MESYGSFKVDFIRDAFSQLRISGITVEPTPDDLELALMRLENMAHQWFARNICTSYNFEDTPDPNTETGVPRKYSQAFATNLAVRLIPDFNKQVPLVLQTQASASLSFASTQSGIDRLNEVPYPDRQPIGSGNARWYGRWYRFYRQSDLAPNSCATNRMVSNDIQDYVEDYTDYLIENEYIESFAITTDPKLDLLFSETDGEQVKYRIQAGDATGKQQVTISVRTNQDRVTTRFIFFELTQDSTDTAGDLT